MLTRAIRFALALELVLICLEGAFQQHIPWLPLGGSHIAQIGICLGLAVASVELRQLVGARRAD
jgi:hypothetical protein